MARHAYWVILVGATPTAFRSSTRDVLVPTLRQLQHTQSDVTLRWFERGRLWESPEAARFGLRAKPPDAEKRRADWRPGGDHRDPRARFELTRDQKRARFKDRERRPREQPPSEKSGAEPPPGSPQPPDRSKKPWLPNRPARRPWQRPNNGTGSGDRFTGPPGQRPPHSHGRPPQSHGSNRPFKPRGDRPFKPQGDRPFKPQGDRPGPGPGAKPQRPFTPHAPGPKPQRPGGPYGNRPAPYRDRPKGRGPGRPPGGRSGPGRPPGGRGGPNRGGGGNRQR